ncbi:MAG: hypothetical protein JW722_06490 [Demequinaceae bacterium]|nr:hypothetical protein [Demequinaceae bacterium]
MRCSIIAPSSVVGDLWKQGKQASAEEFGVKTTYKELYFGLSDSRNEAHENREEFLRSYVDLDSAAERVVAGRKFLVLGPKGTGKSALAWFLQESEPAGNHLALIRDASTLPLAEVTRVQTGQEAGPERTVVAWKFILLTNYLELLLRDQSCSIQQNREVQRVSKLLRDFGFVGDAQGRALLKAAKTTLEIPIPKLGPTYRTESNPSLNIFNLIPYLENWVCEALSGIRHVLLLDGLDSIFLNDAKYDESLSSLVQAAYAVNQKLLQHESTGSVVLLMRNDSFSRIALSLPDSQKMRDDLSLELDWRVLSGRSGTNAPLMQLVNAKAAREAGDSAVDVLGFFPDCITVGGRNSTKKIPVFQYLLNLTRHTPRDLLRLFEEIRKVDASGTFPETNGVLSQDIVREGVLRYSTKYFVGAIQNEFAGISGGPEQARIALNALQAMNRMIFNAEQFAKFVSEVADGQPSDPEALLRLLFFAGAIGNHTGTGNDERYLHFYHRRDDAEVYLRGRFILHNALIHAWGLRHGSGAPDSTSASGSRRVSSAEGTRNRSRTRRRRRANPT